jgi:hypothetical protein
VKYIRIFQNKSGVNLRKTFSPPQLKAIQEGVRLTLAPEGLKIKLVE